MRIAVAVMLAGCLTLSGCTFYDAASYRRLKASEQQEKKAAAVIESEAQSAEQYLRTRPEPIVTAARAGQFLVGMNKEDVRSVVQLFRARILHDTGSEDAARVSMKMVGIRHDAQADRETWRFQPSPTSGWAQIQLTNGVVTSVESGQAERGE